MWTGKGRARFLAEGAAALAMAVPVSVASAVAALVSTAAERGGTLLMVLQRNER
jgi:hypothetical protein